MILHSCEAWTSTEHSSLSRTKKGLSEERDENFLAFKHKTKRRRGEEQGCQMAKFDPFLSLDCARVEGVGAQSKERKGSNFAAQRSRAIVQKPKGTNTYDLKIWK